MEKARLGEVDKLLRDSGTAVEGRERVRMDPQADPATLEHQNAQLWAALAELYPKLGEMPSLSVHCRTALQGPLNGRPAVVLQVAELEAVCWPPRALDCASVLSVVVPAWLAA